jgi:hypothetical protein
VYVIDTVSLQLTGLQPLRDVQNQVMDRGVGAVVTSNLPDSIVYVPWSTTGGGNGLGIATMHASRITRFTFLTQLSLPSEVTNFTPVQPWRDGMVFSAFSTLLTIPGGVYAIRPWPTGPATLLSSGPRQGRYWTNVSVYGDHAIMFDSDRMYVLDLNTRQFVPGITINDIAPGLGSMMAFKAVAPGMAVVVTHLGTVVAMDLSHGAVIGWLPGVNGYGYSYSIAVHSNLGILISHSHQRRIYQLGSPSTVLLEMPQVLGPMDTLSVVEHARPSFFTYEHGCASGEPYHDAIGLPSLGNSSFALTVSRAQANVPGTVFFGTSRTSWGPIVLPLALDPFGITGCKLLTDPQVLLTTTTSGSGDATMPLPIPLDPSLAGQRLMAQWITGNPTLGPGALRLSEAALLVPR